MKIITISGVDGSGKSTQVKKLSEHLEKNGHKVYYFHAVAFSVANQGKHKIEIPGEKRAVTKASWHKVQMRKCALLIDLIRFDFLTKKLERQGYTILISDRYFYDSLINIFFLSQGKKIYSFGVDLLASMVYPPQNAFFLNVPPEVIYARERDIEQGKSYIEKKTDLYREKLHKWHITEIDGNRTVEEIHVDIKDIA